MPMSIARADQMAAGLERPFERRVPIGCPDAAAVDMPLDASARVSGRSQREGLKLLAERRIDEIDRPWRRVEDDNRRIRRQPRFHRTGRNLACEQPLRLRPRPEL